jgi:hypothetical protein
MEDIRQHFLPESIEKLKTLISDLQNAEAFPVMSHNLLCRKCMVINI